MTLYFYIEYPKRISPNKKHVFLIKLGPWDTFKKVNELINHISHTDFCIRIYQAVYTMLSDLVSIEKDGGLQYRKQIEHTRKKI